MLHQNIKIFCRYLNANTLPTDWTSVKFTSGGHKNFKGFRFSNTHSLHKEKRNIAFLKKA